MTAVEAPSLFGRVLALALRPLFIFFDVTLLGYVLLRATGDGDLPGYGQWLRDLFPLDERLSDAVAVSLQVVVAATIVAVVLGAALSLLQRGLGHRASVMGWSLPLMAIAGPTIMLMLVYWLGVRFSAFPVVGATRFTDDPGDAMRQLVLPALAVGLPMAPPLATIVARDDHYGEPYGMTAAGSLLATRSESRDRWRFGFPAGLLIVGLLVTELGFARPGVARLAIDGLVRFDYTLALDALALIALGGAVLAVAIDLIGLRPHRPTTPTASALRLAEYSTKPPSKLLLGIAGGSVALLVAVAGLGVALDPSDISITETLARPLSDGHLLGTDQLGRDLLVLAVAGTGESLLFALVPALFAVAAGVVLALLLRALGVIGEIVPGAVIDGFWWPLPLLAVFAAWAFAGPELAHPAVLALFALGLVPTALRLLRREPLVFDAGGWLRIAGAWFLLAAVAFLAHLAASFAGLSDPVRPSLGAQMSDGLTTIVDSVWPAAVPATVAALGMLALYGFGSSLIHFAAHRRARVLTSQLDVEHDQVPVRRPGQPILAGEPARFVPDLTTEPDWDDGGPLAPNYHLQPGLPHLDPYDDTISLDDVTMIPPPPVSEDEHA